PRARSRRTRARAALRRDRRVASAQRARTGDARRRACGRAGPRRGSTPCWHQLRGHGQPRLLPTVRLPVALDRARLLHAGARVPVRLRAQRAARRRHGVDGLAALMGRLRGIALDVTPLRESRDFRLLWAGDGITAAGSQFTRVAAAFQVYELTGSTLMVGLLGLVTM